MLGKSKDVRAWTGRQKTSTRCSHVCYAMHVSSLQLAAKLDILLEAVTALQAPWNQHAISMEPASTNGAFAMHVRGVTSAACVLGNVKEPLDTRPLGLGRQLVSQCLSARCGCGRGVGVSGRLGFVSRRYPGLGAGRRCVHGQPTLQLPALDISLLPSETLARPARRHLDAAGPPTLPHCLPSHRSPVAFCVATHAALDLGPCRPSLHLAAARASFPKQTLCCDTRQILDDRP
ncbi:hypothetical protein K458DRAFT_39510 [Lentithecium fluviatile CBS 122367]|uniref:Uncharacterized protein n=1 Tax=Lentithecium fluviatile CBS 122367 TaxID=1168545 RepID=A0A6G1IZ83_9PLEO|nr:hypothetical protein K458DRAFT_39510 [Lentithecium fluviatile CBS 122367]